MSEPSVRIFTIPVSSATAAGVAAPNNPEDISQIVAELNKAIELVQQEAVASSVTTDQLAEMVSQPLIQPLTAPATNLTIEVSAPSLARSAAATPIFSQVR